MKHEREKRVLLDGEDVYLEVVNNVNGFVLGVHKEETYTNRELAPTPPCEMKGRLIYLYDCVGMIAGVQVEPHFAHKMTNGRLLLKVKKPKEVGQRNSCNINIL